MVLEFIILSKSRQCLQIHYSSNINPLWASTLKPSSYIDTSNMITCSGLLWRVSPPTFVLWLHHIHCTWTPSEKRTGRVAPPRCPLKAEVATQTRGSLPSLRSTNMCSDRFNPPRPSEDQFMWLPANWCVHVDLCYLINPFKTAKPNHGLHPNYLLSYRIEKVLSSWSLGHIRPPCLTFPTSRGFTQVCERPTLLLQSLCLDCCPPFVVSKHHQSPGSFSLIECKE